MKVKLKKQHIIAFCLTFILLIYVSCDRFVSDSNRKETIDTTITTSKEEAKLLVKATKESQNVLALSRIIKRVDVKDDTLTTVVSDVEEEQIEILKNLEKIARDKIISTTSYAEVDHLYNTNLEFGDEEIALVLLHIKTNIEEQIEALEKLKNVTDDTGIEEVSEENIEKLKEQLDYISSVL